MNIIDQHTTPFPAQIEALFEAVEQAIIDFGYAGLRGGHAKNWHALRIATDGSIYTSEEPSPCYSEEEYFSRTPHPLTIHSVSGNCWYPTPEENPGWMVNEDGTLDLEYWCGDALDADEIVFGWRDTLQAWVDAGNFCPADEA